MNKNNTESFVLYDKKNNRSIISPALTPAHLMKQFVNPGFYNAFKAALRHRKENEDISLVISGKGVEKEEKIECGFAVLITDNRAKIIATKESEALDAIRLQKDVLMLLEESGTFKDKESLNNFVLDLLYCYTQAGAVSYDEFVDILVILDVRSFTDISNDQLENLLEKKKENTGNVTFLSEEEYEKAIEAAEKEFNEKGLGFFGGAEDDYLESDAPEGVKDLAGEKKKLFLSGELIATFKDQKSFDSFLEFCRNNYFVGAFDMNKKLWKFKKYFYLAPTEGNLKVCATNRLDGITFDGIVNGKVFKK
ncbi:MAG: hypothetical protein IKS09_04565 [Lachnospiraceae bacterium]|nr:hypothetical protein [Lachnospiraceae bacterium]